MDSDCGAPYPHFHVVFEFPDGKVQDTAHGLGIPTAQVGDGLTIFGRNYIVAHTHWMYMSEDGTSFAAPALRVILENDNESGDVPNISPFGV